MEDLTVEVLAERFDRLERRLSWWKKLVAAVALTAALLAGMVIALMAKGFPGFGSRILPRFNTSSEGTREVRVKNLVLTDESEKPRASLGVDPLGSVELGLEDESGKPRARFSVDADGSAKLSFLGEDGSETVSLVSDKYMGQELDFSKAGKQLASLSLFENYPTLSFLDEQEDARVELSYNPDADQATGHR